MKFSVVSTLALFAVVACAILTQSGASVSASSVASSSKSINWSYDAGARSAAFQPRTLTLTDEPDEFEGEEGEIIEPSSSSTGASADTGLSFGSTGSSSSGGSSTGSTSESSTGSTTTSSTGSTVIINSSTGSRVSSTGSTVVINSSTGSRVSSTGSQASSQSSTGSQAVVSSGGSRTVSSSTAGRFVPTIPVETSTGASNDDGMPESYPLIGFTLAGNPTTHGGLVSLSSAIQIEIADSIGVPQARVVVMSLAADATNTTSLVSFSLTNPALTTDTKSRTAARFFLATGKASGFMSTLLQSIVLSTLQQVTDRAVFKKLPAVTFKLNYDLTNIAALGGMDTFKSNLRTEIAAALALRADRLVILDVKAGSLIVDFLVTPVIDPTVDAEPDQVAAAFVAQVNDPTSTFRSNPAGLGAASIENSAAVEFPEVPAPVEPVNVSDDSNDDIGRLTRAEFGGVMAVSIFLFLALIAGVVYFLHKKSAAKNQNAAKNASANGFADVNRQPAAEMNEAPIEVKVENPVYAVPDAPAGNPDENVQVVRIHSSLPSPQHDGAREASTSSKRAADVERAYLYQSQQHEKQPPETTGF